MPGFGGAVKLTGESEYKKALQQISQNLKEVGSQMKLVASEYSQNDKSVEALTAKENVLNQKLDEQKNKLSTLKSQYSNMESQYSKETAKHEALIKTYDSEKTKLTEIEKSLGTTSKEYKEQSSKVADLANEVKKSTINQDANAKSMSNLRIAMNNAQTDINKTTKEIDELGKETAETDEQVKKSGDGFTVYKGILANLATAGIMAAVNGLKKLGSSLVDIAKQSYSAYAEYEQLVGGVETLFGESADELMKYANNAYKTAGLSANEYMEQATSFSATLLQGLEGDTAKAVEYANLAISDMSDNANKMGTDISMIQNAYQGFAKDNYTMLDNLKLGYGGTASEMARLVNDTKVLGTETEVTAETVKDVPFDKIIEAIHKTQEQIGITGTTMKEAEGTIEGSTKAVKASWQNLLVGIADENADLKGLIHTFVENVVALAKNAVPRIKQIVSGLWQAIKELLKEFAPNVAKTLIPVVEKIMKVVKELGSFIINNFDKVASIVLSAAAAFATLNAAMKVSTMISNVTTAINKAGEAASFATKMQQGWNAAMSANPIGAVITAITLLVGAIITLSEILPTADAEHERVAGILEDEAEKIQQATDSWNDLKEAQQ
ncbi:MAG: hypothetical protein E7242_05975, partial [Lachnospiraceae bacterium]|nr:hypothetical protein [Lachnospiraceae bacterium]